LRTGHGVGRRDRGKLECRFSFAQRSPNVAARIVAAARKSGVGDFHEVALLIGQTLIPARYGTKKI